MSNFYSVIPTNVIFSSKMKPNEKILYGVLASLTNERGEVYLTNQEIADLYNSNGHDCSARTVSGWVNTIVNAGLFTSTIKSSNIRVLKIAHNPLLPIEKPNTSRVHNYQFSGEINSVMDYYEQVHSKRPKLSDTVIKNMIARFKEGYTVVDFQKVISVKSVDPFFVENPQYQLPKTLFRPTNFVNYLNEYEAKAVGGQSETDGKKPVLSNEEF